MRYIFNCGLKPVATPSVCFRLHGTAVVIGLCVSDFGTIPTTVATPGSLGYQRNKCIFTPSMFTVLSLMPHLLP